MRFAVVLAFFLILVPVAHAEVIGSQWNDSNTVQLPGGPDTYPGDTTIPPDQGTNGGTDGTGGSGGGTGTKQGGGTGGTNGTGGGTGGSSGGPGDVIIFSNPSDGSSNGSGSGSSGSGSGQGGGQSDAGSLLDTLLGSGGISGSTGATGSLQGGSGQAGSGSGAGVSGSGSARLNASNGVFIDGAKVRSALQGKGILRVTLRAFGAAGGMLSNSDLGLIGASSILKNPALESAFISLSRFDITYRSQGYLLAFVPISFPVRISVNPGGSSLADRVTVKFPWYSFFLRKFVSKSGLAADIDAILVRDADPAADRSQVQAKIFTDVSVMLQSRIDTVDESVTKN
jgi:hypothetical protein